MKCSFSLRASGMDGGDKAFTCQGNTSSECVSEFSGCKDSQEVEGHRKRGTRVQRGRCHHRIGGMLAGITPGVCECGLKGKVRRGCLISPGLTIILPARSRAPALHLCLRSW